MPSEKKRINLTVSDEVYEKLQQYKDENGLQNDATACLHLMVLQLKSSGPRGKALAARGPLPEA